MLTTMAVYLVALHGEAPLEFSILKVDEMWAECGGLKAAGKQPKYIMKNLKLQKVRTWPKSTEFCREQ